MVGGIVPRYVLVAGEAGVAICGDLWRFVAVLLPSFYATTVLGSVLGCLSMWVEVPDRDALRRKISTPTVNGGRYG